MRLVRCFRSSPEKHIALSDDAAQISKSIPLLLCLTGGWNRNVVVVANVAAFKSSPLCLVRSGAYCLTSVCVSCSALISLFPWQTVRQTLYTRSNPCRARQHQKLRRTDFNELSRKDRLAGRWSSVTRTMPGGCCRKRLLGLVYGCHLVVSDQRATISRAGRAPISRQHHVPSSSRAWFRLRDDQFRANGFEFPRMTSSSRGMLGSRAIEIRCAWSWKFCLSSREIKRNVHFLLRLVLKNLSTHVEFLTVNGSSARHAAHGIHMKDHHDAIPDSLLSCAAQN